jgi:hypothetical protein
MSEWDAIGVLRDLTKAKLVFIETKDVVETTLALDNYRRACDSGRGAVFLSVARGKVGSSLSSSNMPSLQNSMDIHSQSSSIFSIHVIF